METFLYPDQSTRPGSLDLWLDVMLHLLDQHFPSGKPLSLLDLCCGEMTNTSRLHFAHSVHVDVQDMPNRPPGFRFIHADVLADHPVFHEHYDVALCSDGIEHLRTGQAAELLLKMEKCATLAVLFTPLGDYMVEPDATHPDRHKSGWLPETFRDIGFHTATFPNWHPTLNCGAFFAWKSNADIRRGGD
jgi:hypothetical protein